MEAVFCSWRRNLHLQPVELLLDSHPLSAPANKKLGSFFSFLTAWMFICCNLMSVMFKKTCLLLVFHLKPVRPVSTSSHSCLKLPVKRGAEASCLVSSLMLKVCKWWTKSSTKTGSYCSKNCCVLFPVSCCLQVPAGISGTAGEAFHSVHSFFDHLKIKKTKNFNQNVILLCRLCSLCSVK